MAIGATLIPQCSRRERSHTWGELLPSTWFLSVYQQLQGHGTGLFPALAQRAIPALGIACVLAGIAYGLSYRWFYLRTSERVGGAAAAPSPSFVGCCRWEPYAFRGAQDFIEERSPLRSARSPEAIAIPERLRSLSALASHSRCSP